MIKKIAGMYKNLPGRVKASFWFIFAAFMQRGVSVITTPIFTRLLSTDEYGNYQVFTSWMGIITVIVTLNLFYGVYLQGLVKFEQDRNVYTSSIQGLCFTLCSIWALFYICSKNFWNNIFSLNTLQMVLMFVIIWSSSTAIFWSQEQRTDNHYKVLVVLTLIVSVMEPLIQIILVRRMEDKVTARIIGMAIVEFLCYSWCFFVQLSKGKKFYVAKYWKYALTFNIPLVPHYLSSVLLNSSDRIMIGRMVGDAEAGIYSLAYSISLMMALFNTALLQTVEPWIYRKIKDKDFRDIKKVSYISFSVIAGVNLMLIALAPEIIRLFAPQEYYAGIYVVPPVAMSNFFTFIYSFFAAFEFYYEKKSYIAISTISGALLNIGLNYIFIRVFGYIAAGYTTLVCFALYAFLHYCFMKKICRDYLSGENVYNTKSIILISTIMMGGGFFLLLLYNNYIIRYCVISLVVVALLVCRKKIMLMINRIMYLRNDN